MVANFVKTAYQISLSDGITHPRACHTIALREGPHPNQPGIVDIKCRSGPVGGKFDIGLVQHQKAAFGQCLQGIGNGLTGMPCAHWIVGVGQINQLSADLCGFFHQRHRVFVIIAVGYFVQVAAKAQHVIIERRIGPV